MPDSTSFLNSSIPSDSKNYTIGCHLARSKSGIPAIRDEAINHTRAPPMGTPPSWNPIWACRIAWRICVLSKSDGSLAGGVGLGPGSTGISTVLSRLVCYRILINRLTIRAFYTECQGLLKIAVDEKVVQMRCHFR